MTSITTGRCHCGAVHWSFTGEIPDATICNCTSCQRYAALWAYGHVGEDISIHSPADALLTYSWGSRSISYNFCKTCGNIVYWQGLAPEPDGRTRIAVNLRLAEPEAIARIPLQRFNGRHDWTDLPRDGRTVKDVMF